MKNPQLKRAYETSEYTPHDVRELGRCAKDPIYFMTKYVKVQHPTKGSVPFELFEYQVDMVMAIHENKDTVILASRQLGKTTVAAMYILWFGMFNDVKKCIIASKAMKHATEIMSRIKYAYEQLPDWIKPGCKFYNRTSIEFDNGSVISCEATSEKTGRGESPAIMFIDEIAFISRTIQDAMWASIAPALSTGGKFIITSTPNGDTDLFANIWNGALNGMNSFMPIKVMWYQHPDRGEAYYKEMLGKLGPIKTRAELDCEFVSSDALLINSIKVQQLKSKPPLWTDLGFKFWIPEGDLGGLGKTYLVSVDPASGNLKDHSAIEIFEFPSLVQVAEWRSNSLDVSRLYSSIKWILARLARPVNNRASEVLWTFERNGIGESIVALFLNDPSPPEAELISDENRYGVYTTEKVKIQLCLKLKSLVEKQAGLKINSEALIVELKNFAAKGKSYEAKTGFTDDSVMATINICRLVERLSQYNEDAFKMVNEYLDPNILRELGPADDEWGMEPVPFSVG